MLRRDILKSLIAVPGALLAAKAKRPATIIHEAPPLLMPEEMLLGKVVDLGPDIPQYVRINTTVSGAESTASFTVEVRDMAGRTLTGDLDVFKGCAKC